MEYNLIHDDSKSEPDIEVNSRKVNEVSRSDKASCELERCPGLCSRVSRHRSEDLF